VTTKLQQMASGFVYNRDAGTPSIWFSAHKFDRLAELLDENQRANTIVVYNYQEELAELKRRFPHAQTIDDYNVIERWNRGEVELLLVHPKSAGHGLNLQHGGCHMVFLSLPWSLELYEQTVGRLHRSGQKRDVWVYVMMADKTIDERIWAALHNKRAVSDVALEELKNGED
jgi:SNF2 family DNA or RNA helicase